MTSARLISAALPLLTFAAMAQEPPMASFGFTKNMACVKPDYPAAAARVEAQGAVHMTITVGEGSMVTDVVVTKGSGDSREHRLLDRAAREAFLACRWLGQEPVPPGPYPVQYVFKLQVATPAEAEAWRRGR